jgi:hypothetical protein
LQQKASLGTRFPDSIAAPWQHTTAAILVRESSSLGDEQLQHGLLAYCWSWTMANSLVSRTCCSTFSCKWTQGV